MPTIPSPQDSDRFNKAYYDRYYRNPKTRAATPASCARQAAFISAYLRYLEVPVRHILDVGCGTGMLLRALSRQFPKARCTGIELSGYLCDRYGWINGSVTDLEDLQADLVVCNDVLGYLNASDCQQAVNNLTAATLQALYLGVLTTEDLQLIDRSRTDPNQIDRSAAWYRRRLKRHFANTGGGLWLKQPLSVPLWSLEHLE